MNHLDYYVCDVKLCGERFFLLWYSDDNCGVCYLSCGNPARFQSAALARRFAEKQSLTVMNEEPAEFDYDGLVNYLNSRIIETEMMSYILDMWNFVSDMLPKNKWSEQLAEIEGSSNDIYKKLFRSSNVIPITPQWNSPEWEDSEWHRLAQFFEIAVRDMCSFWRAVPYEQIAAY